MTPRPVQIKRPVYSFTQEFQSEFENKFSEQDIFDASMLNKSVTALDSEFYLYREQETFERFRISKKLEICFFTIREHPVYAKTGLIFY